MNWRYWGLAASIAFQLLPNDAHSAEWPIRPVRVIVPYGAGGVTDTMARMTADRLSRALGQPFLIENRPGAGGAIGTEYAIRAANDGYTLLFTGGAQFSVVPLVQRVNYDPVKDLAPISIVGINGQVLAAAAEARFRTFRQFVDYARGNPGKVSFSTAGPATNTHLAMASLSGRLGLEMIHVPFNSGPAALTALLSRSVDVHFGNSSDMIEPVRSSSVTALGVSTPRRMPQIQSVPAISEEVPGFELLGWNGWFAPAGTNPEIIDRAARILAAVANDADLKQNFYNLGIDATVLGQLILQQLYKKTSPSSVR